MRHTYIASDTTAGNATTLGDQAGRDVVLKKLIFGTPTDGKITIVYNKLVAYGHASGIGSVDSGSIAVKHTQPTAAAGKDWARVLDFGEGIRLDGGSIHTNDSQVTACWEYEGEVNS